MNPVVAVVAPGMMGAAVGGRLVAHGLKVLTSLQGRSADTVARAKDAGMTAASDEEIARADFILSILPPGDAVSLAQRFAPALTASNAKPVYVDCNAISPADRRAGRGRHRAHRLTVRGRRHHRLATAAEGRQGSPFLCLRHERAALRDAKGLRPRRARAGRSDERSLGAENVVCRHHQGHAGTRRSDDAGGDPRRLRPTRCSRN